MLLHPGHDLEPMRHAVHHIASLGEILLEEARQFGLVFYNQNRRGWWRLQHVNTLLPPSGILRLGGQENLDP